MGKQKISSCATIDGNAPLTHQLMELFWILGPAYARWAESHMTVPGLTPQRIRLLVLLEENGPMKMSSLSDELGVAATTVTALVDALEKDSMVKRKRHATDRRATLIELTRKAEECFENCDEVKAKISGLFSGISKANQQQLVNSLLQIRAALVDRGILEDAEQNYKSVKTKRKA
jgi:DNA-binding MarR family transcriptional regulator